jgi:hypothetical protein
MPIHDWTRVEAGDYHHFHQTWTPLIAAALNRGLLPPEFMAMTDQVTGRPIPDVVTLQTRTAQGGSNRRGGGVAIQDAPPSARLVQKIERINYARRANRVIIRHGRGKVVAIIEILSPGNKDSQHALRSFIEKAAEILDQGINLFVVDLFPPTPRDPQGIHPAIWGQFSDEPFDFLPERPLTVASYLAVGVPTAYVDSLAVGDPLPSTPIFLTEDLYVPAPLESTYMQAWEVYPELLKELITGRGTT